MGKVMMLALLVLTACGEGGGDDGAGGAGGSGGATQPPDEAPRCEAPQVQPCPEGTEYAEEDADGARRESCVNDRHEAVRQARYTGGRIHFYSIDGGSVTCWPSGLASSVTTCTVADCSVYVTACYTTEGDAVGCEDAGWDADWQAAWGF